MKINWFKKQERKAFQPETVEKAYQEEVYEVQPAVITSKDIKEDLYKSFQNILAEFDLKESKETEIENLQSKLEKFKAQNKEVYDKIEILKNLGLSSTPTATQSLEKLKLQESEFLENIQEINKQIEKANKIKELTSEYLLKYPSYKFIDGETIIKIMHKYDLVLGESFMYSREIPYENLEIINNFVEEIKENEKVMLLIEMKDYHFKDSLASFKFLEKPKMEVEITPGCYIPDTHYLKSSNFYEETVVKEFTISKFKIIAPENHFTIPTHSIENSRGKYEEVPLLKIDKDSRKYEFTAKKLNEVEKKRREVLDPIACLEVEGGYIIMSAWDKEAEIPEIKNILIN